MLKLNALILRYEKAKFEALIKEMIRFINLKV